MQREYVITDNLSPYMSDFSSTSAPAAGGAGCSPCSLLVELPMASSAVGAVNSEDDSACSPFKQEIKNRGQNMYNMRYNIN